MKTIQYANRITADKWQLYGMGGLPISPPVRIRQNITKKVVKPITAFGIPRPEMDQEGNVTKVWFCKGDPTQITTKKDLDKYENRLNLFLLM